MTPVRTFIMTWLGLLGAAFLYVGCDVARTPKLAREVKITFEWQGWDHAPDALLHGLTRLWIHFPAVFVPNAVLFCGLLALLLTWELRR